MEESGLIHDREVPSVFGPGGVLFASWLMWVFIGAWAITPSSVLPLVMASFGVRETAAAWVISAPQIAATITGIPIGMVLDRLNQRHAIVVATGFLALTGIGATVAASIGAYWLLLAVRVLGGLGLVAIWTAQTATITRAFPPGRRATAVGIFVTGYPAGYAVGQFSGPVIAATLDWTATFGLYAVIGFAFAILFWVLARSVPATGGTERSPSGRDLRRALTNRGVWGVAALSLLSYMIYMIFNSWMPTYLSETFEIGLTQSGFYTALFPAIGILSRPSGGILAERAFGGRSRPIVTISFLVAGAAVGVMALGGSLAVLVVGLVVAGFAIQLQFGILYTLVQQYVPKNVAGTAVAVVSAVGWLGIFLAPPAVGALIQHFESFLVVFGSAVALAVGGLLIAVWISEPTD